MADSGVKAAGDITGSMATATESTAGLQTAVDGVAEGQSPGGFRGLIARLKESMGAFTQFATTGTQSAAAVAGVVDTTLTPSLMKTTNELKMTPWDMWKTMGTVAAADTGAAVSTQLVPTIEETTEQLNATPWGEMAARASDAANKVGGVVNGVVGASILQTTDKIRATPWMEYAQRGIGAGTVSANAIKNVQSAIDSAAGELASSDWSGWADELASAAREAQEAVDAVSLGSSPGGLKEIPLKIAEARKAFAAFEEMGVGSAEEVKKSVDALSGAQATIGMAGGTATAASVAQTPLAGAASGGGETFHISIQALDASGVDQITESKLIPAIVRVLRKGGRGVSDVQGVLR
jgi:hypothetical protein